MSDALETNLSPHGLFSLVAGLYVAAMVAPAATAVLAADASPWRSFATLLGNLVVVTTVVGVAVSSVEERVAVRLGRARLTWALPLAPFGYGAWLLGTRPDAAALWFAMVGLAGGLLLGLVVVAMATNRAVRNRAEGERVRIRWSAKAAPKRRRLATWAAVVGGGGGVLAIVAGGVFDVGPVTWVGQFLAPLGAGIFGATEEREYLVLEEGLVVRAPVTLRLVEWNRFESIEATSDALAIRRSGRWHLDVSCDVREIEDVGAAKAALSSYLPERT